jgi:hypothetical protein
MKQGPLLDIRNKYRRFLLKSYISIVRITLTNSNWWDRLFLVHHPVGLTHQLLRLIINKF